MLKKEFLSLKRTQVIEQKMLSLTFVFPFGFPLAEHPNPAPRLPEAMRFFSLSALRFHISIFSWHMAVTMG